MKRLWHWLNHTHSWKVIKEGPLFDRQHNTVGHFYYMQCTSCGNIKEVQV